jgi:hypothetical protein
MGALRGVEFGKLETENETQRVLRRVIRRKGDAREKLVN